VRSENVGAMQDILLGGKVDLFGEDKLGAKALNEAVVLGHTEIVNILLNNGVDINGTNNGFWPLGIACKKGNDFMAEHLVEKGADVNQKSYTGMTALKRRAQALNMCVLTAQLLLILLNVKLKKK